MEDKKKKWLSNSLQLLVMIGLVFLLRKYVFMPVEVVGTSMEPTYHDSDRLWQTSLKKAGRFDSITFPSPRDGKNILKRVVGLPGDTIRYENDKLYINDKLYEEPYLDQYKSELTDGKPLTTDFSLETIERSPAKTVPEGTYFVLGDNRRIADDSRYFGFVDQDTVVGVVYFQFYPLNQIGIQ